MPAPEVPTVARVRAPDRHDRRRAVLAAAAIVFVAAGALGIALVQPSHDVAPSGSPPPTGAVTTRPPEASARPDLSFVLPQGTIVVDESISAEAGAGHDVRDVVGALAPGIHHWGMVARCSGPSPITWTVGADEQADRQSGDMACDGVAHGTGIITRSTVELPVQLAYSSAANFRFVLVLISD